MRAFPGKTTNLTQSRDTNDARLRIVHDWAAKRHIWINQDIFVGSLGNQERDGEAQNDRQSCNLDCGGFGVFVKREASSLVERQTLMLVPKVAILSPRSSSVLPYIDTHQLYSSDATAGLYLSLTLLHELLLGPKGTWWGYLQSLPRIQGDSLDESRWGISLPIHWDSMSAKWKWINGTEAARILQRAQGDPAGHNEGFGMSLSRLRRFFTTVALPTLRRSHSALFEGHAPITHDSLWSDFIGVHSIVSSRAFVVDMFHGQALVPLADMFNHAEDANVHFEADDEVCDECGALGKCMHSDDPLPSAAYGRPSAFLPAAYGPNSEGWSVPTELDGLDTVDMVAQETIFPGQEAYNSYGLMSNAALLTAYGFCLEEETEYDRCVWEWRNAAEREEFCSALGLACRQKRKVRGDGVPLSADHSTYEQWTQACISFSQLTEEDFAELREDPLLTLFRKKVESRDHRSEGVGDLMMPLDSPFASLARPLHLVFPADIERREAQGLFDETFVDLSGHDGSRDGQQPLFVDAIGRLSLPLWRAVLLSSITSLHSEESFDLDKMVTDAEQYIAGTVTYHPSKPNHGASLSTLQIVRSTLEKLKKLVSERLGKLHITRMSDGNSEALKIIEGKSLGPLRSCVLHAFHEASALRACVERLDTLLSSV